MVRSKLLTLLHNNVEENGKVYVVDITSLIVWEKMAWLNIVHITTSIVWEKMARLIAVHITTSIVSEKMARLKLLTLLY